MSAGVGSSSTWVEEITCVTGKAYKGSGHAHPCKADGGNIHSKCIFDNCYQLLLIT
jgi:hypothetical protein